MVAFAANSVLCRLALREGAIDAASFTAVRLVSGAVALGLILLLRDRSVKAMATQGNQGSALALFVYAAGFSLAYVELATGTGALLLFGAVQATMIGIGLYRGERLAPLQWLGLMLALAGLVALMLPGATAPPLAAAALMLVAGAAWGVYSLRGKGAADATAVTAGNFLRALIWLLPLALFAWPAQWPQGGRAGVCGIVRCPGVGSRLCHLVPGVAGAGQLHGGHGAAECAGAGGPGRGGMAGRGLHPAFAAGIGGDSGRHCVSDSARRVPLSGMVERD